MSFEPGDITPSQWNGHHDHTPYPVPEPSDYYTGRPEFLSQYTAPLSAYVDNNLRDEIRIRGQRPITIEIKEQNPCNTSEWRLLGQITIQGSNVGFIVKYRLRARCAGRHTLFYIASNPTGKQTLLRRDIIVNQRQVGG